VTPPAWRPDIYVVSRFLEALWLRGQGPRRTALQMAVGLNSDVFTRYLSWLEGKGLVTVREEGATTS